MGRKRVAILLKNEPNFEKPSDIDGLIYIQFAEKIDKNAELELAQRLAKAGYDIDIQKV